MFLEVLLIPFITSTFCFSMGRILGGKGAAYLLIYGMTVDFFYVWYCFLSFVQEKPTSFSYCFTWFSIEDININWNFLFDGVSLLMCCVVVTISWLVHIFSYSYMREDPNLAKFMSLLSLFTFCMLLFVTSGNFVQMFAGWEAVGVCSYLLVGFWNTRVEANKSALKAIAVNKVGDIALLIGLFYIYQVFGSFDYGFVFNMSLVYKADTLMFFGYEVNAFFLICLFLFIGVMAKSAQFGLHTWLPDAMEGPTPVSALIHAATMVTAGVFLIIRISPLVEMTPYISEVFLVIGSITCLFGAMVAFFQHDIKKVIAYSTCSQLGYMVYICGMSSYNLSFFHLCNHAFFKALLFLSAGTIIHALADEQDMRKMGGLIKLLPFTYLMVLTGSLALMGFPFLSGYYSKDIILEISSVSHTVSGQFAYWLGLFAAFFTAAYSFRLLYWVFISKPNGSRKVLSGAHDVDYWMFFSLSGLFLGTLFFGYLFQDLMIGMGSDFFGNYAHLEPKSLDFLDSEFIATRQKWYPFFFSMAGSAFSAYLCIFLPKKYSTFYIPGSRYYSSITMLVFNFFSKKWFVDSIYNHFIVYKALNVSYFLGSKSIERGIIDFLGGNFLSFFSFRVSNIVSLLQNGRIQDYFFFVFFIVFLPFSFYFYPHLIFLLLDLFVFYVLGFFWSILMGFLYLFSILDGEFITQMENDLLLHLDVMHFAALSKESNTLWFNNFLSNSCFLLIPFFYAMFVQAPQALDSGNRESGLKVLLLSDKLIYNQKGFYSLDVLNDFYMKNNDDCEIIELYRFVPLYQSKLNHEKFFLENDEVKTMVFARATRFSSDEGKTTYRFDDVVFVNSKNN